MNTGSSRIWVKIIIVIGFSLATLAVAGVAYLGFSNVKELASELRKNAKPDRHLETLQDILDDLFKAESSVRAFTITQNPEDLEPYYQAITTIDKKLDDLGQHSSRGELMDSINIQVTRKFELMDSLIDVLALGSFPSAFEKLYTKITDAAAENNAKRRRLFAENRKKEAMKEEAPFEEEEPLPLPDSIFSEEKTDKKKKDRKKKGQGSGIFNKIFGNKKKRAARDSLEALAAKDSILAPVLPVNIEEVEEVAETPKPPDPQKLLREFKRSAEQYGKQESEYMADQAEQILAFTLMDQEVMSKILDLMEEMAEEHQQMVNRRVAAADEKANKVIELTRNISIIVGALFMILLFVIFRDFARNRRLQRRLSEEKNRAEKLTKAKEEFLSNMSHEIRTPMNAVIGFSEQMSSTDLDPRQHSFLKTIRRSASHLLALINDVLDYSKLESGNFTLEKIGLKPLEVVDEVHETFYHLAKEKGIRLEADAPGRIPPIILGDPLRLKQMLFNLVNNAIKFTDEGVISVIVTADAISSKKSMLRFMVKDTGVGIPKDKISKIFEDFEQVDTSTTRRYGGTGLGLSITRKLTDLHKGHITIESEPGKGTAITLNLPFDHGTVEQLPVEEIHESVNLIGIKGRRALIADDEPYNQALVAVIMEKWQVKADIVSNGIQAIKKLKENNYDFVLLDLQMPVMGGLDAVGKIRNEMGLTLPVIGLTATSTQAEIDRCLSAGMDGHLLKPFREFELYEMIVEALGVETVEKEGATKPAIPNSPSTNGSSSNGNGYHLDELFELGNQDKVFVKRMLNLFVENTQEHLTKMGEALEKRDWKAVGFTAHKIIPPARHLGLDSLVEQLKHIETSVDSGTNSGNLPPAVLGVSENLAKVIEAVKKDIDRLGNI